jgi:hypothetical protein
MLLNLAINERDAMSTRNRWFESVSLQRRVCKLSVPLDASRERWSSSTLDKGPGSKKLSLGMALS